METATTKASTAASAGSQDDQLDHKTSAPHCGSAWPSSSAGSEQLAGAKKKGTSSGFRKMREDLMAKKFESQDNLPVRSTT